MRRAVVVGLFAGCAAEADPPAAAPAPTAPVLPEDRPVRPIHTNPPSPRTLDLTPADATGRPLFRNADGTCFALVAPAPGKTERLPAECPPALADPAWAACLEGRILQRFERGEDAGCVCAPLAGEPSRTPCPAPPAPE